jgi:rod shape-determining protein MreD
VLTGLLILAFLMQSVVSTYLSISGITPDFLLAIVVSYGLLFGWEVGLAGGVIGGLLIDLIAGRYIGLHVLAYGTVGVVAGLVEGGAKIEIEVTAVIPE